MNKNVKYAARESLIFLETINTIHIFLINLLSVVDREAS